MNKDKINELIKEYDALINDRELKDLSDDELSKVNFIKETIIKLQEEKEVRALDITDEDKSEIRSLLSKGDNDGTTVNKMEYDSSNKVNRELTNMYLENKEVRDYVGALSNNKGKSFISETRELNTVTGAPLIPTILADKIHELINAESDIASKVRQVTLNKGINKIPVEGAAPEVASFLAEYEEAPTLNLSIEFIELTAKRIGASALITKEIQSNTPIDLLIYTVNKVSKELGRVLDTMILVGPGYTKAKNDRKVAFGGIVQTALTQDTIDLEADGTIDFSKLQEMKLDIKYSNLSWVMSRKALNILMKTRDGNNKMLALNKDIFTKTEEGLKFLGLPVLIHDSLEDEKTMKVVLGALDKYYLGWSGGMQVSHGSTMKLSKKGLTKTLITEMVDGDVAIPDAFSVLTINKPKADTPPAPKPDPGTEG